MGCQIKHPVETCPVLALDVVFSYLILVEEMIRLRPRFSLAARKSDKKAAGEREGR
jgi:hypothetical protein